MTFVKESNDVYFCNDCGNDKIEKHLTSDGHTILKCKKCKRAAFID
jgi:ribosomal protein L37AE/L43A